MLRLIILLLVVAAIVFVRRFPQRNRSAAGKGAIGSLEGDQQVLAALAKAGADLSKPTEVNYYLYFEDRRAADSAAAHAGAGPLVASVRRGADDTSWLCFVSGQIVPSEAAIHAYTARFVELARVYGGEYDGWEAAVSKDD